MSNETSYKTLCEFEKSYLENFVEKEDGKIEFSLFHLDENEKPFLTQSITYHSFEELFEKQYKNAFVNSLESLDIKELDNHLGNGTLDPILARDNSIRSRYEEITKERDLDIDGSPDRIDMDDTKNTVQTVGDLSTVKNATNKEIQTGNEKKEKIKPKHYDRGR
ncbi:hypothetical protein CN585_16715 [Bacillus toyonensis]|uniref:DUF4316 domain-containing protein n=1 Tax=Bacillus toyonensis TaxID=155322 RepID=A0A2A8HDH9_9BACI|nr:hypothetical protein CN585_16715 [Bacillus toyonensis]